MQTIKRIVIPFFNQKPVFCFEACRELSRSKCDLLLQVCCFSKSKMLLISKLQRLRMDPTKELIAVI